jgi:hypothetical protein
VIFLLSGRGPAILHAMRTLAFLALHGLHP